MLPNKLKEMVKCIKYHMVKAKADSEALLDLYRFLFQSYKRENACVHFWKRLQRCNRVFVFMSFKILGKIFPNFLQGFFSYIQIYTYILVCRNTEKLFYYESMLWSLNHLNLKTT